MNKVFMQFLTIHWIDYKNQPNTTNAIAQIIPSGVVDAEDPTSSVVSPISSVIIFPSSPLSSSRFTVPVFPWSSEFRVGSGLPPICTSYTSYQSFPIIYHKKGLIHSLILTGGTESSNKTMPLGASSWDIEPNSARNNNTNKGNMARKQSFKYSKT